MEIKAIKTRKQYEQYLQWVDEQFDKKIKSNSGLGELQNCFIEDWEFLQRYCSPD